MTEEEYFRKNYPDSCYGDRPLSPYWDFFEEGVEFGERQSEKKIAELEKENAELKEALKGKVCNCMTYLNFKDLEKECAKAKELLRQLVNIEYAVNIPKDKIISLRVKAEQFLKEIEK